MLIDASRGEIQLDDLFNAIEHDKDQVAQALDIYADYLKVKNESSTDGDKKIELLERILKLDCIDKTVVNSNHENERSRINLKWTVLSECGIWHRKLGAYEKAIGCFEKANSINNRVSTIYYEMGMCYLELGNVYQVKTCLEKTIEISHEHVHWKCLEQLIYFYFILGNFCKCLEYIRVGYDRVATYRSTYDLGQLCLVLLQKKQPSMKTLIEKMFKEEMEYDVHDESLPPRLTELEANIAKFKEKLLSKTRGRTERKSVDERVSIENFQDFGQYLAKKVRESTGDNSKLAKVIDVSNFVRKNEETAAKAEDEPMEQEPTVSEEPPPPAPPQRKKRSQLPLNLDDYEKRRSARSIVRMVSDDSNVSMGEQLRRLLSNDDDSSDEEGDETLVSPDNIDDDIAPTLKSDLPKETFPPLAIEYAPFIHSIEEKVKEGYRFHCIDLISAYIHELTRHSSTLWTTEMRLVFTKLFDCLLDHVQHPTTVVDADHLRACVCYVENALGSAKSDLSEDSIERFSCFARLKVKYKSLGYCFARLQFFLYLFKNSALQQEQFTIDETLYRILWISSLYYFLSDVQDDALACIYQLQHVLPEDITVVLPNLFNHTTISKTTVETLYFRLKNNNETSAEQSSSSSSSQELTYILSRIAVADEKDELVSLIKKLEKKIKLFYANLTTQVHLQQKSLIKCCETLLSVLNENQHLNEKENVNVRRIFDQIFIQVIEMIIKLLDEDCQWRDASLKTIEKLTLNLIDAIMKRDAHGNVWPFKSTNPWILLYRVTIKRDSKKNEQFIVSYVRTVHELFGKQEKCLVENGGLLEYFLLELIQIEHPDIRKILFSKQSIESRPADDSDDGSEQKSKSSKVMDEIEQCVYCLYGLVLRKSKMKYLNDHSCSSLELTLEKASIVFYALRPRHLPGYEGRACTITNETESLFQRFESMIEWDDEREHRRKLLISHVSNATPMNLQGSQNEELMHLADKPFKAKNALFENDLYYLFADYYLKMGSKDAATNDSSNKKAQEYYIKDLCMNPRRFDSWAGLTVIEFAKIEELITADDFDARIFNTHMSASCYFRQAVSVDTNNHTLWMEYAEITYILQSYCSKYKGKSAEYVPDRSFLLNICKEAYEKANLCTDNDENKEDWTHLYMMAKIEEKLHRSRLFSALQKYASALDLLHENKALYPRKIGHHTSTSNSKGTLLGCHAVEMFYRIHASALKYLNRHNKETVDFAIEKLNELHAFLTEMQTKPFVTSYYEKSTIPNDGHAAQLINNQYFSQKQDLITDPWLTVYHQCIWLCVEGLYLCIARYNRHYRALYRLAHFFHTNEFYRDDRLSLDFLLGGNALELKNYPKIIGLYQERSKHNLFNGIWRIQPLDADRTGSFNASMYKSTRLFVDLLLHFDEQLLVLVEVLRQLLAKPDADKKYVREIERKTLCQHTIKNFVRSIKRKIANKTRDDIQEEGMRIISAMDEADPTNVPLPILFEAAIQLYNLLKNFPAFYQNSKVDELVESTFQRYKSILKFSSHLPENPKAESLTLIYTPKKQKPKVIQAPKRPTTAEATNTNKRQCVEPPQPPPPVTPSQPALPPPSATALPSPIQSEMRPPSPPKPEVLLLPVSSSPEAISPRAPTAQPEAIVITLPPSPMPAVQSPPQLPPEPLIIMPSSPEPSSTPTSAVLASSQLPTCSEVLLLTVPSSPEPISPPTTEVPSSSRPPVLPEEPQSEALLLTFSSSPEPISPPAPTLPSPSQHPEALLLIMPSSPETCVLPTAEAPPPSPLPVSAEQPQSEALVLILSSSPEPISPPLEMLPAVSVPELPLPSELATASSTIPPPEVLELSSSPQAPSSPPEPTESLPSPLSPSSNFLGLASFLSHDSVLMDE